MKLATITILMLACTACVPGGEATDALYDDAQISANSAALVKRLLDSAPPVPPDDYGQTVIERADAIVLKLKMAGKIDGAIAASGLSPRVGRGEWARVPEWEWVDPVNFPLRQEFSNGSREMSEGDSCGIKKGGQIDVLSSEDGTLLVLYGAPGKPMGTPCPSGTMFLTSREHFDTFEPRFIAELVRLGERDALIKRLMAKAEENGQ